MPLFQHRTIEQPAGFHLFFIDADRERFIITKVMQLSRHLHHILAVFQSPRRWWRGFKYATHNPFFWCFMLFNIHYGYFINASKSYSVWMKILRSFDTTRRLTISKSNWEASSLVAVLHRGRFSFVYWTYGLSETIALFAYMHKK